jgi:hypothetical protein
MYSLAIPGSKFFSFFFVKKLRKINLNILTKSIKFTLGKKIPIVLSKNQQNLLGKKTLQVGSGY